MKIADVRKMKPIDRFLYWIRERHSVHQRRRAGDGKPWTDDEVLQSFFFTNPYRENDKVTIWFRNNIRQPLQLSPYVIFATVAFRWFNWPETAIQLMKMDANLPKGTVSANYLRDYGAFVDWDNEAVKACLHKIAERKTKVFTGAYMITVPPKSNKIDCVCDRINAVWEDRDDLCAFFDNKNPGLRLQDAHKRLMKYKGLGGFMAYEVVCDLRYTAWLETAPDKDSWCNPGPGAARGLLRLQGKGDEVDAKGAAHGCKPPDGWEMQVVSLLRIARKELRGMPPLEMREIEHSLCEWDKYERALNGKGKMKRRYNGTQ